MKGQEDKMRGMVSVTAFTQAQPAAFKHVEQLPAAVSAISVGLRCISYSKLR